MKHWIGGIVLAVLAFVLLYASAATSQTASVMSLVLLLGCIVLVLAIFFVIAHASKHMTPVRTRTAAPSAAAAGSVDAAPVDPAPWAGTAKTLGVALVGLVGLLVYVGILVGAWANVMGWIIYLAIAMTFSMLVITVLLTMGKTE